MSKIKMQGIGYLGDDPKIITFENGDKIANVSIGVTENWKNKEGEKQSKTEWLELVFSGGLVKVVESYLKKGSRVYFEGKQTTDKWVTDSGEKRSKQKCRVMEMEMLGDGNQTAQSSAPAKQNNTAPDAPIEEGDDDDELPF